MGYLLQVNGNSKKWRKEDEKSKVRKDYSFIGSGGIVFFDGVSIFAKNRRCIAQEYILFKKQFGFVKNCTKIRILHNCDRENNLFKKAKLKGARKMSEWIGFVIILVIYLVIRAGLAFAKAFEKWQPKVTKIKYIILAAVLVFIACGGIVACNLLSGDGEKNSWNDLSKDEKDWLVDNYGNGKYDQYQDAINDYKK